MKADEFYRAGQQMRGLIEPFLPGYEERKAEDEAQRLAAQQQQQGQQRMQPQQGTMTPFVPPTQSPTGGEPAETRQLGDFAYNANITDRMIKQYTDNGFSPEYAVGMAANGIVESSLNVSAYNEGEDAYGIFQWRHDRLDNLRSFADRTGKSLNDVDTHVAFSIEEKRSFERAAYERIMGSGETQSAEQYARLIDQHYERSDGKSRERRASIAAQLYQDYFGEGGRAGTAGISFGQDTSMVGPNAMSRDEMAFMGMEELPFELQNQPEEQDLGFMFGADDLSMGNEPTSTTSIQPIRPVQSPTGGQVAMPQAAQQTLFQPPAQGGNVQQPQGQPDLSQPDSGMGSFDGGFRGMFTRREGEDDDNFRDRRRSMFLGAASGFQMLSRGTTADFITPAQQRLDQQQRRTDNRFNVTEQQRTQFNANRDDARLQRAQALSEQRYNFEVEQFNIGRSEGAAQREAIANMAEAAGMDVEAKLARLGLTDTAVTRLTERNTGVMNPVTRDIMVARANANDRPDLAAALMDENADLQTDAYEQLLRLSPTGGDAPYTISPAGREAFANRAISLGRPDIAEALNDTNPAVVKEAVEQAIRLESVGGDEASKEALRTAMIASIPANLPQAEQERLRALADVVAETGGETTVAEFMGQLEASNNTPNIADSVLKTLVETDNALNAEAMNASNRLLAAADNQTAIVIDPNFKSDQFTGAILAPLARWVSSIPGAEAIGEEMLGVNTSTMQGQILLDAIRDGEIGPLAQGLVGALSNQEGQRILSAFGTGTQTRTEILALNQIMRQGIARQLASEAARERYLIDSRDNNTQPTTSEYNQAKIDAANSIDFFQTLPSDVDRLDMQIALMEEYGVTDPSQLPAREAGKVVVVLGPNGQRTMVPLFNELYQD